MEYHELIESGAVFSDCRIYRYDLWRVWNRSKPQILFIGLNPSTADEITNDATVRRCIGFTHLWGFGGFHLANLFAYRATLPSQLKLAPDPVGPENDAWLQCLVAKINIWVLCWGNQGKLLRRDEWMHHLILDHGSQKAFYLANTRQAQPQHLLYLPANAELKPYINVSSG